MTASGHDGIKASVAYDRILLYFQAARTQQRRISRLIQKVNLSRPDPARRTAFNQIFAEIHFYFIAWNTIQAMFEVLSRSSRLSCIKPLPTFRVLDQLTASGLQRANIVELSRPVLYCLTPILIAPSVMLSGMKLR